MFTKNKASRLIIIFSIVFLFFSCDKASQVTSPQVVNRGEIVSVALAKTFTSADIQAIGLPFVIDYNIKAYKIIFKTIDGKGSEINASGIVLVPQINDSMATIFHSHGSAFTKTEGAASELGSAINEALLFSATKRVIIFPDYIGYGASKQMFHPYHIEKYYATSSIDLYRAAKKLCKDSSIKLNGKNFLMGYSEGSYATISLQKEIEKNYSDEFKLTAVAAGAGALSLSETSKFLVSSKQLSYPAYVAYVFYSYKTYYNLPYTNKQIFNEPYASKIDSLFDGSKSGGDINKVLSYNTATLLDSNFIAGFLGNGFTEIKNYFAENDLVNWTPKTKLRLFHGQKDITVPYINSEIAYNNFKNRGADVSFVTYTSGTADHTGSAYGWFLDTATWFSSF